MSKNFHTTIRIRRYVVDYANEKIEQEGFCMPLGLVVEQLINHWLSGSVEVGVKV